MDSAGSGGGGGGAPASLTDVPRLVAIVQAHVPAATVSTDIGQELQMRLPLDAAPAFPALFEELEVRRPAPAATPVHHHPCTLLTRARSPCARRCAT